MPVQPGLAKPNRSISRKMNHYLRLIDAAHCSFIIAVNYKALGTANAALQLPPLLQEATMASKYLRPCKACGKEFSKHASACPNCRHPILGYRISVLGLIFFSLFWIVMFNNDLAQINRHLRLIKLHMEEIAPPETTLCEQDRIDYALSWWGRLFGTSDFPRCGQ